MLSQDPRDPSDGFEQVPAVVKTVIEAINALVARVANRQDSIKSPSFLLLPCGWMSNPQTKSWYFIAFVIEPEVGEVGEVGEVDEPTTPRASPRGEPWPPTSYRLTVCNSGGEGMNWHGATA